MLSLFLFINFYIIGKTYCIYTYILLVGYHSCCPHGFRSVEGLLWGAEPRYELGPALQQADAILFEPRRTLYISVPRRTLSYKHEVE